MESINGHRQYHPHQKKPDRRQVKDLPEIELLTDFNQSKAPPPSAYAKFMADDDGC